MAGEMMKTERTQYASVERDTDLSNLEFVSWEEVSPSLPADFRQPVWRHYGGRDRHDEAVFCLVRVLGHDYLLSAYLYDSSLPFERSHWVGDVCQSSSGKVIGHADTKDEVIGMLVDYARDVLSDEQAVIGCLNETDLEFVRQARDAGAAVSLVNNESERNKRVEIEIGSDLSTEEHPFRQGFLMMAYARPEGCEWNCWYHFNGLHAAVSRTRGITVDARKGFSVARIVEDSRTCDRCGEKVPLDEIQTVGFANGVCEDCVIPFLSGLPRGWCN